MCYRTLLRRCRAPKGSNLIELAPAEWSSGFGRDGNSYFSKTHCFSILRIPNSLPWSISVKNYGGSWQPLQIMAKTSNKFCNENGLTFENNNSVCCNTWGGKDFHSIWSCPNLKSFNRFRSAVTMKFVQFSNSQHISKTSNKHQKSWMFFFIGSFLEGDFHIKTFPSQTSPSFFPLWLGCLSGLPVLRAPDASARSTSVRLVDDLPLKVGNSWRPSGMFFIWKARIKYKTSGLGSNKWVITLNNYKQHFCYIIVHKWDIIHPIYSHRIFLPIQTIEPKFCLKRTVHESLEGSVATIYYPPGKNVRKYDASPPGPKWLKTRYLLQIVLLKGFWIPQMLFIASQLIGSSDQWTSPASPSILELHTLELRSWYQRNI